MEMWIARDKDGELYLYREKPTSVKNAYFLSGTIKSMVLDKRMFPQVTFENSPQKVGLMLIK